MTLEAVLLVSAALVGIGVYGALSQQAFVMIMMGFELILAGAILAGGGLWAWAGAGNPKGQLLVVVLMTVMAVETALGFGLIIAVYRVRKADITEKVKRLKR
ncbi:MAG: NADH-quinone oxidoreductase subunit NuoK [Gemmatimonadota bacterium]